MLGRALVSVGWGVYFIYLGVIAGLSALSNPNSIFRSSGLSLQAFVILSGSMEPFIMTGDAVLVDSNFNQPKINDVITFKNPEGITVTHRIVAQTNQNSELLYTTKGDNNQAPDPDLIKVGDVIGLWKYTLPKAGYLLVATGKPVGISLLLLTPIILYLLGELFKKNPPKKIDQPQTKKLQVEPTETKTMPAITVESL